MSIKHLFTSAKADGGDPTVVQPSNWNADHTLVIPGGLFTGVTGDSGAEITPMMMGPWQWALVRGHGSNSVTTLGAERLDDGSLGGIAFATTSLATRQQRTGWASAAVANSACGSRLSSNSYWRRSTTVGQGGFFFHARFALGVGLDGANGRLFVGMGQYAGVTIDPSTQTGDFIGIGYDAADTHLQLLSRDNVTTQKLDLGASVPKTAGIMYDVYLYCPPGGAAIYYRIDISNGNTFTARVIDSSTATNLPRSDVTLIPRCQGGTSTTTVANIEIAQFGVAWQSN